MGELVLPALVGHFHASFGAGLHSAMLLLFLSILAGVALLFKSFNHQIPSHGWGSIARRSYSTRPDINLGLLAHTESSSDHDSGIASSSSSSSSSAIGNDNVRGDGSEEKEVKNEWLDIESSSSDGLTEEASDDPGFDADAQPLSIQYGDTPSILRDVRVSMTDSDISP